MDTVVSSERELNHGHRAGSYVCSVQDREAAVSRLLILAAGVQVAISFGRICRPRDEARLANCGMLAGLPHPRNARCDICVTDTFEAHGPKGGPKSVLIRLPCVAVIAAGQLTGDITENSWQVQLGRLGIRVDLEPDKLPDWRDVRLCGIYLGMHGGERPQGVVVVHECINVDNAVFFEVVADMAPVVVLEGVEPSCLFRLGITAREHTEPVGLRIVSHLNYMFKRAS